LGVVTRKLAEGFPKEKVSDADLLSLGVLRRAGETWLKKHEINTLKSL
jgi:hypothetical protein